MQRKCANVYLTRFIKLTRPRAELGKSVELDKTLTRLSLLKYFFSNFFETELTLYKRKTGILHRKIMNSHDIICIIH